MSSLYPSSLDTLSKNFVDDTPTTGIHPGHHNQLADALMKIQAELGTNPRGSFGSVRSRLDSRKSFDITDPQFAGGAVPGGVTINTAAIQAAHDAAFAVGGELIVPTGNFLTDTINWKYVPIRGEHPVGSRLTGRPGKDIIHVDPSLLCFSYPRWYLRDLHLVLDDSVNASGNFLQRHGVGNACIAIDFPNGAGNAIGPVLFQGSCQNLLLETLSMATNGQNASAGLYLQFPSIQTHFDNVRVQRFFYGWWEDYPVLNVTQVELFGDHNEYEHILFDHNGHQMRLVNNDHVLMNNVVFHGTTPLSGFETLDVPSLIRTGTGSIVWNTGYIEAHAAAPLKLTGAGHQITNVLAYQRSDSPEAYSPPILACDDSSFIACNFGAKQNPQLRITGKRNKIDWYPVYEVGTENSYAALPAVDDQGSNNQIEIGRWPSGAGIRRRAREANTLDYRVLHTRDSVSTLLGYVNPAFVSGSDLILNPKNIYPGYFGGVEGTSFSYVADALSEFGYVLRALAPGGNPGPIISDFTGGVYNLVIGNFIPPCKVRIYIRGKASVATTQSVNVATGTDLGTFPFGAPDASKTFSWTTGYTTQFIDVDWSAKAIGQIIGIWFGNLTVAGSLDVSSVAFRPYQNDLLLSNIQAANPDTSGASLAVLEAEVNELKAAMRNLKLIAP